MRIERRIAEQLARTVIKPMPNNFVERPWAGARMREFKGFCSLPDQHVIAGIGIGECFEISASETDAESSRHPSRVVLPDGATITLSALLAEHGDIVLGTGFMDAASGRGYPLLPKTLDVGELLSVQGHPSGNTEAYLILDAEPGATLRVGFNRDVDRSELEAALLRGRERQAALAAMLRPEADVRQLQVVLKTWMANRAEDASGVAASMAGFFPDRSRGAELEQLLVELKTAFWLVLDSMNVIAVSPGMVIHNATPPRIAQRTGAAPTAEVHALGNPEGRGVLALEIRKPGPTFRAWDNVRFPIREVDVVAALNALNLRRTRPEEFIVGETAVPGQSGVSVSVDSEAYRIEHLRPTRREDVRVPRQAVHSLHGLKGSVRISNDAGAEVGSLRQGESGIVAAGVGGYTVSAVGDSAEVIKVSVPR